MTPAAPISTGSGTIPTLGQGVSSVFLDRLIGLAVVVFLTPLLLIITPPGVIDRRLTLFIIILACFSAAGLVALFFMRSVLAAVFGQHRLVRLFIAISEAFRTLVRKPLAVMVALFASFLGYGFAAATLATPAAAMGIPVSLVMALPVVCMMTLATFVPISIGGWGVREAAALVSLRLFSTSAHEAVALSILYGLIGTAIGILGGTIWILDGHRRRAETPPLT